MTMWLAIGALIVVIVVALVVILRLLVMVSDSEFSDEDSELVEREDYSELAERPRW